MRYAIVSDIHANLQAFEAVLADMAGRNVDSVLCLGDVVGYGTQPVEVLALARRHVDVILMGNHDAATAELMDTSEFSDGAVMAIENTRTRLSRAEIRFLETLPYECNGPGSVFTHADLVDPGNYDYVQTVGEALRCFNARSEQLMFVGHTHEPAVFVLYPDGTCGKVSAEDGPLLDECRYLINPGSVGMPRTNDLRATYCIYDDVARTISFQRVAYDVEAFRKMIEKDAKGSEQIAYVLELLDSHKLPDRVTGRSGTKVRVKKRKQLVVTLKPGGAGLESRRPVLMASPALSKALIFSIAGAGAVCLALGIYALNHAARRPAAPDVGEMPAGLAATPEAYVPGIRYGGIVLEHRWSFNKSLADAVGGQNASVVNVGTNDVRMDERQVTIRGGARDASDYVSLGSRLLAGRTDPVTIELWATRLSDGSAGRIFDFGGGQGNSLMMAWSVQPRADVDSVEWSPVISGGAVTNSNGPYLAGKEYHIVMIIEPAAVSGEKTRVRWYSSLAGSPMLGAVRGSFFTDNSLATMVDLHDNLARSFLSSDVTAGASYNEVRIWRGVPSWTVLEKLHQAGPDAVFK